MAEDHKITLEPRRAKYFDRRAGCVRDSVHRTDLVMCDGEHIGYRDLHPGAPVCLIGVVPESVLAAIRAEFGEQTKIAMPSVLIDRDGKPKPVRRESSIILPDGLADDDTDPYEEEEDDYE